MEELLGKYLELFQNQLLTIFFVFSVMTAAIRSLDQQCILWIPQRALVDRQEGKELLLKVEDPFWALAQIEQAAFVSQVPFAEFVV